MKNTGYYTKKTTEVIDENGSTKTLINKFQAGVEVSKLNNTEYSIIYSAVEFDLLEQGDKIMQEMLSNPLIFNPSIEIKKTGSKPHLVARYSMIEPKTT